MQEKPAILGIDAGSISISFVLLDARKQVLSTEYTPHNGDILASIKALLRSYDFSDLKGVAITSSTPDLFRNCTIYDNQVAAIYAAKHLHPDVRSLLIVGGEKFGLARFNDNGDYLDFRSNSSCAAGSGSFLDQQSKRLNLNSIKDFSRIACDNKEEIPKIASRCAVFAKTDLIHAQQEGYSLAAICDGLSHGLAKNIIDTLISSETPQEPLVFAGGVSNNPAVVKHLSSILGVDLTIDEYSSVYGAIGAALMKAEELSDHSPQTLARTTTIDDLIIESPRIKNYDYKPLELKQSSFPDFNSKERFEVKGLQHQGIPTVETDIYTRLASGETYPVFLGIDIGSTSTKAVILSRANQVMLGLYTRTSGRPVEAVQTIFEVLTNLSHERDFSFEFIGVGTTGSGRKFVGEIVGADLALDEITAHARAAIELDPAVDTIIEIGGQDSKFTTLKNGVVTFSIMNNVCAAGTGSFIEEQAKKLGCPLSEYSQRAEKSKAPLSNDKCTVFMERDLNHYLSEGYSVNEALASVLHSVRDNYLSKVAIEANIGQRIFFQGATAKNKALVAAFEQKLNQPIMVSKYCHLTGALGTALHLADSPPVTSNFRGISLYNHSIPLDSEVCDLCNNHCKIKKATVNNKTVAFGFLCGRDYQTKRFVKSDQGEFDLIRTREKILKVESSQKNEEVFTIGIPAALHLFEDLELWSLFFNQFSIKTITSKKLNGSVKSGKQLTGAEFCAPICSLHGHVAYLTKKADFIFLPDYFENKRDKTEGRRQFCYYTQYAPALIQDIDAITKEAKILNPSLKTLRGVLYTKIELYQMLKSICQQNISFLKVSNAYDKALSLVSKNQEALHRFFIEKTQNHDDISVVLLGRPYTVLSRDMNSKIPDIFSKLGVKTFYQDMLPTDVDEFGQISSLLKDLHWNYPAEVLKAAEYASTHDGLYPVLVTSFKCTPDSYAIEAFKNILDARKKPYLILQLDEHDSSIGYETRIEAGIRSFRNHSSHRHQTSQKQFTFSTPVILNGKESLSGKNLILPNFDHLPCKLIEAVMLKEGINTYLMEESDDSIKRSMTYNQGQCLPITMMAQAGAETIEKHQLDPAKSVIWTLQSDISCNLGVMPQSIHNVLKSFGGGMEKVQVYAGEISYLDISIKVTYSAYFAFMFGGFLKKMGCKIRPYELIKGATDKAVQTGLEIFYEAFLNDTSKEDAVKQVVKLFEEIKVSPGKKPRVAIFGDLYARDNNVFNQNLIRTIEENGGEALTTPYSEHARMIANPFILKWIREGRYSSAAKAQLLLKTFPMLERKYHRLFNQVIQEQEHNYINNLEEIISPFHVKTLHTGESLETLLKIFTFISNYPDISLFVQTSPSLCCPSLVTEAMAEKIESITDIPIVNIEYDGTGSFKNDIIIPYLKFPRKKPLHFLKKAQ